MTTPIAHCGARLNGRAFGTETKVQTPFKFQELGLLAQVRLDKAMARPASQRKAYPDPLPQNAIQIDGEDRVFRSTNLDAPFRPRPLLLERPGPAKFWVRWTLAPKYRCSKLAERRLALLLL
jgi:hypothetical protein